MIAPQDSIQDHLVLIMLLTLKVLFSFIIDTFHYVGVAILCCEGILTILPIRDSMSNKFDFKGVAVYSMITAFGISILIALITVPVY